MPRLQLSSEFLTYLAAHYRENGAPDSQAPEDARLPTLTDLSDELGLSISCLREQLEVAKALGLVDVRPRLGIRRLPYTFLPAVRQSLSYAITVDRANFIAFSSLRNHIEAAYWHEAVQCLTPDDHQRLQALLARAWQKLDSQSIHIPHAEHRQLHLTIFSRLDNVFVQGLLEAYWEAYEAVGLDLYTDYNYLRQVWGYHQRMVDAICVGDFDLGYRALVEHKDLLFHRPQSLAVGEKEAI
ncbi:MAG: FadR family transcriptional regulator [Anaerolineales bacterium]|nr:FadR family transcriptional regulator [Anaerolineales bacterium]